MATPAQLITGSEQPEGRILVESVLHEPALRQHASGVGDFGRHTLGCQHFVFQLLEPRDDGLQGLLGNEVPTECGVEMDCLDPEDPFTNDWVFEPLTVLQGLGEVLLGLERLAPLAVALREERTVAGEPQLDPVVIGSRLLEHADEPHAFTLQLGLCLAEPGRSDQVLDETVAPRVVPHDVSHKGLLVWW